jgi:hypothetical protein
MENRIQINGVWYVPEKTPVKPKVKTVKWLIDKLQELADEGYNDYEVTIDIDYGGDYDTINEVSVIVGTDHDRVHIR